MKVDRVKVSESSQRLTFVVFLHFSGVHNKSYSQAGDNGSREGASGKPRLTDGSLDQWQAASQEAGPARLTHTQQCGTIIYSHTWGDLSVYSVCRRFNSKLKQATLQGSKVGLSPSS